MKKEIMELINANEGTVRLNAVSYLTRWTVNAMGEKVDMLRLEFDSINGVRYSVFKNEIVARDYNGIIKECEAITNAFFAEVARSLTNNLKAGYRNV
ncbi:MAG: hypothetical protein UD936_06565 [Acutalibacteraceae bacterium]|nr:hypothetical protein [Acutalibacteraceae bacterium]